ncbi:MAG: lamin tail domain-containing protein [Bacteroidales bacterium]|nr:lamin tail domain-containing protein [Bacteroidales bacterium]MBN2762090.1 lamin tail domain-containing protein [Bacteroidales bacterium]
MKAPFVIFSLLPFALCAQINEDFETGDLRQWQQFPPQRWESSAITPINGQYALHHIYNNNSACSDRISLLHDPLYLDSLTTTWKFKLFYACQPSSENNWAVYLTADRPSPYMDPDSIINAYVIGVNLSGNDDILRTYKIMKSHVSTIIETDFNWQTMTSVLHGSCIEVTRNPGGKWSLSIDTAGSGQSLIEIGRGTDKDIIISGHTGLTYNYTRSNDQKIWFDDLTITGFFREDKEVPCVENIFVMSSSSIKIIFTEDLKTEELTLAGFSVNNNIGMPAAMTIESASSIVLTFNNSFISSQAYDIIISKAEDIYGNANYNLKTSFLYYDPQPYNIVISEIMADPSPAVNLPEVEYLELFNNSGYNINLQGWVLTAGEKCITLPSFLMEKQSYVVLCEAPDSLLLKPYGPVLPIHGMPALNNKGQTLTLTDAAGEIIHSVTYSDRWFSDIGQSEGGWSLEIIDPDNPCGGYANWDGSEHFLGGTPGFVNSVRRYNPDNIRPVLLHAATTCDSGLLISFNEPMQCSAASDQYAYSVNNNIFHPVKAEPVHPDFSNVLLTFLTKFEPFRQYELMVKNSISDCSGNLLPNSYISFGLAYPPDSFDLVINEILFDAHEDEDYVEIVNRSEKIVELLAVKVVLVDEYTGKIKKVLHEITAHHQLLPEGYTVLTGNAAVLQKYFHCRNPAAIIEATGISSLPGETGAIALLDGDYRTIDKFIYSSDYHDKLITNPDGISLERLNGDIATNNPDNWHSASADAGFGTPGYKNSQSIIKEDDLPTGVWTEPEVFTPDNDSHDDYIVINYHFDEPGIMANVMIFDNRGCLVKQLANNVMLGTDGFFIWDGTDMKGLVESAGLYLIYTEVFSEHGSLKKFKNTCVLAKRIK